MNIPEEAIKAAAKIVSEQMRALTRSDYHGSSTETAYATAAARYALAAAAPLIAAQAWDEGAAVGERD